MKKTIILFLIFLIPIAYAFSGSNANYETIGSIGLAPVTEHSNANYETRGIMVNQPISLFESANYKSYLGPYYLYVDIYVYEIFNILLNSGWNLVSIPLVLDNKTLAYALSSIEGNYSKIFTYINGEWIELKNNSKINETIGFWIKIIDNDTLTIEGFEPETTLINLNDGWNLIGYPSLIEENISIILKSINNSLINVLSYENSTWFSYSPLKNNSLIIKPGFGYWVNVDDNVSLVIS